MLRRSRHDSTAAFTARVSPGALCSTVSGSPMLVTNDVRTSAPLAYTMAQSVTRWFMRRHTSAPPRHVRLGANRKNGVPRPR